MKRKSVGSIRPGIAFLYGKDSPKVSQNVVNEVANLTNCFDLLVAYSLMDSTTMVELKEMEWSVSI